MNLNAELPTNVLFQKFKACWVAVILSYKSAHEKKIK